MAWDAQGTGIPLPRQAVLRSSPPIPPPAHPLPVPLCALLPAGLHGAAAEHSANTSETQRCSPAGRREGARYCQP